MSTEQVPIGFSLFNAAMLITISVGLYSGQTFGEQLALGLCWIVIVLALFFLFLVSDDDKMREARLRLGSRGKFRIWVGRMLNIPVIVGLAGFGHWATFVLFTVACIISIVLEQSCVEEFKKELQKDKAP